MKSKYPRNFQDYIMGMSDPVPEEKLKAVQAEFHKALNMAFYWGMMGGGPSASVDPLPVELAASPIEGWRGWRLNREGHLAAIAMNDTWKNPHHAECQSHMFWWNNPPKAERRPGHKAPDQRCQCGLWAVRDENELKAVMGNYSGASVYGKLILWGKVIECERGWRAEYAKPTHLWVIKKKVVPPDTSTERMMSAMSAIGGVTVGVLPFDQILTGLVDIYKCPVEVV